MFIYLLTKFFFLGIEKNEEKINACYFCLTCREISEHLEEISIWASMNFLAGVGMLSYGGGGFFTNFQTSFNLILHPNPLSYLTVSLHYFGTVP